MATTASIGCAPGPVYGGDVGSAGHRGRTGGDAMRCQHEIAYEDRSGHLKSKPCPKDGARDGWCLDHAHSRELLATGAQLGYPAIDELHLSAGRLAWAAYAECFPRTIEIMKKGKQHSINRYDEVIGLLDAKLRDSARASRIVPNGSQIDEKAS